jgi:hypothetical protein
MPKRSAASRQQSFLFVVADEKGGYVDYGFRLSESLMQDFATCMKEADEVQQRNWEWQRAHTAPVQRERLRQARAVLRLIKKKRPA